MQRSQVISQSWSVTVPGPCQVWWGSKKCIGQAFIEEAELYSPTQQDRSSITVIYVRKFPRDYIKGEPVVKSLKMRSGRTKHFLLFRQ